MEASDSQLGWVQRNREASPHCSELPVRINRRRQDEPASQPHEGAPSQVGKLALQVLDSVTGRLTLQERLGVVLREHGASELAEQVAIRGVYRGILLLEVAEPALAYHLRLRWEHKLVSLMRLCLPEAGINVVRFITARPR